LAGDRLLKSGNAGVFDKNEIPTLKIPEWEDKMSRTLISVGLVLIVIGILWPWLGKLGIGQLPGDIMIKRENFVFYAPLTSGLLVSIVLSLIYWFFNR
jgi:hypothetical protein